MISFLADIFRQYRFRRSIRSLVKKGMKIGKNVHIMPGVFFDEDYASLISIGDDCTITSGVKILAHDASLYRDLGCAKVGKVAIMANCFIGVNSIILPGVTIGPDSIVGAGSVVTKDVPENSVVCGNPSVVICSKESFLERHKDSSKNSVIFKYNEFFKEREESSPLKAAEFKDGYLMGGEIEANLKWLDDEKCQK